MPVSAAALGVSLGFPILTTDLLDLCPRERGSVSSFQSFLSTCLNAVVAGIVSPAVSGSLLLLAVVAGSCTGSALLLWSWHRRIARRSTATTGSPGAPSVGVVGAWGAGPECVHVPENGAGRRSPTGPGSSSGYGG